MKIILENDIDVVGLVDFDFNFIYFLKFLLLIVKDKNMINVNLCVFCVGFILVDWFSDFF